MVSAPSSLAILAIIGALRNVLSTLWWQYQEGKTIVTSSGDLLSILLWTSIFYVYTQINSILFTQHHLYIIAIGSFIFATLNSTLNLHRVTILPFDRFSRQFLVQLIPLFISMGTPNSIPLMWISLYWIVLVYCHYLYSVVIEISSALKINVFSIKK